MRLQSSLELPPGAFLVICLNRSKASVWVSPGRGPLLLSQRLSSAWPVRLRDCAPTPRGTAPRPDRIARVSKVIADIEVIRRVALIPGQRLLRFSSACPHYGATRPHPNCYRPHSEERYRRRTGKPLPRACIVAGLEAAQTEQKASLAIMHVAGRLTISNQSAANLYSFLKVQLSQLEAGRE